MSIMLARDISLSVAKNKNAQKHIKRVVNLCERFIDELQLQVLDSELLVEAAWLHDIGKFKKQGKKHNKKNIVKSVLEEYGYQPSNKKGLFIIIKNHRGLFIPNGYFLECSILRICDKLEHLQSKGKKTKKYNKLLKKCKKTLKEIKIISIIHPQCISRYDYMKIKKIFDHIIYEIEYKHVSDMLCSCK